MTDRDEFYSAAVTLYDAAKALWDCDASEATPPDLYACVAEWAVLIDAVEAFERYVITPGEVESVRRRVIARIQCGTN